MAVRQNFSENSEEADRVNEMPISVFAHANTHHVISARLVSSFVPPTFAGLTGQQYPRCRGMLEAITEAVHY